MWRNLSESLDRYPLWTAAKGKNWAEIPKIVSIRLCWELKMSKKPKSKTVLPIRTMAGQLFWVLKMSKKSTSGPTCDVGIAKSAKMPWLVPSLNRRQKHKLGQNLKKFFAYQIGNDKTIMLSTENVQKSCLLSKL